MQLNFDVDLAIVPNGLSVIGAVNMKNKCCEDKPVLITKTNSIEVYSCQCACGGWCTNGHSDPADAIEEYESMCDRYIKSHKRKH